MFILYLIDKGNLGMKFFKLMMLAVAITFNLVACGSGGSGGGSTTTTTTTTETPSTGIRVNKIAALADDAKQGISKQVQQQAQQQNQQQANEVKHNLNNDNISYADYGYIEKTVNNQKAYEYFYEIKDQNAVLKDIPVERTPSTYKGIAYMRENNNSEQLKGELILDIDLNNNVQGSILIGNKELILQNAQLTSSGYSGNIAVKENISSAGEDFQPTSETGRYSGVLAGGTTKDNITVGKFELSKDNKNTANGVFFGEVQRPPVSQ